MKRFIFILIGGFITFVFGYGLSMASDPMADIPVTAREFDGFKPMGLRVGKFMVFPSVETGIEYTDNVFQTELNKQSDRLYTIKPSLRAQGVFGDHVLDINVSENMSGIANLTHKITRI